MNEHRAAPRRRRATTGERVSEESFVVRIFTLADYAVIPPDGKVYISGGGVSNVMIRDPKQPFPTLYVVARVAIPYAMTSEPHRLTVRLLDADRRPILSDPLFEFTGETGRPAGLRPDDEVCVNFSVALQGLPTTLPAGLVFFHLLVDERALARVPLRITQLPGP